METKVLVAYATKRGATAEIAGRIGGELRREGLDTDVVPVERLPGLESYQAVVLGSAVYIGQWRKAAAAWLKANASALAGKPVRLFSTGPTGDGAPGDLMKGWRFPTSLQADADRIRPRDIAVFHGVLDLKKLNAVEKWLVRRIGAPVGDYRDWQAIAAWARGIAAALRGAG